MEPGRQSPVLRTSPAPQTAWFSPVGSWRSGRKKRRRRRRRRRRILRRRRWILRRRRRRRRLRRRRRILRRRRRILRKRRRRRILRRRRRRRRLRRRKRRRVPGFQLPPSLWPSPPVPLTTSRQSCSSSASCPVLPHSQPSDPHLRQPGHIGEDKLTPTIFFRASRDLLNSFVCSFSR